MTPIHQTALTILNASLNQLSTAVARLPDEAMDWNPLPGGNPVGVLVIHALTATDFWMGQACGRPMTFQDYRADWRGPAFGTSGMTTNDLLQAIEEVRTRLAGMLEAATEADLDVLVIHPEDRTEYSGEGCLVQSLVHLREHVGHTETMSDFWGAGIGR